MDDDRRTLASLRNIAHKWAKTQPETGLINFDLLEPGLHHCKIAANREAGNRQEAGGTRFRDPFERLKERTSA